MSSPPADSPPSPAVTPPSPGLAALDIAIEHLHIVNLALQHIDVPLVRRILVTNRGAVDVGPLAFRCEVNPPVAPVFRHEILETLRPGEAVELDERVITMPLSSSYLARQLEAEHGTLSVTVSTPEGERCESRRVDVQAFNEWVARPHPETLACFVQPNHPALVPILQRAQDLLAQSSGSGALEGYQSGPARARLIASALWKATQVEGIRYIDPPASFSWTAGQKVLLPDQVVRDRMGTCLDLTVLYASLLQRVGLHPILVLLDGHALPGVLLHEGDRLSATLSDDVTELTKRNDLVAACFVDSSALAHGETFERAEAIAQASLVAPRFHIAIDVQQARREGVLPLPLRLTGDVVVIDAQSVAPVAVEARSPRVVADRPASSDRPSSASEKRLARWKAELLDLSLRNPLLAFKSTAKRSLPLITSDIAALEDALASRQAFSLVAQDDPGLRSRIQFQRRTGDKLDHVRVDELLNDGVILCDLPPAEWERRIVELYRAGRTVSEETGSTALWLALGFVELQIDGAALRHRPEAAASRVIQAPILLVPVEITRGSPRDPYRLRVTDDEPRINSTLLRKLASDYRLDVSGLDELPEDEAGLDVRLILDRFRRLVMPIAKCQILEHAAVGFFSFAKYMMWLDLEARTDALLTNPVVRHLLEGSGAALPLARPFVARGDLDAARPPSDDLTVVEADSSQLVAVQAAVDGNTFVLEGPPGTGKSQTITNIVAELLGRGKSVLFVAEKRAAVDVVQRRLEQVGLGAFVLDLHAPDQTKAEIVNALARNLDLKSQAPAGALAKKGLALAAVRDPLALTWRALHTPDASDISVWQAVARLGELDAPGRRDANSGIVRHAFDAQGPFDAARWALLREATHALAHASRTVSPLLGHPFAGTAIAEWDAGVQVEIEELLAHAREALRALRRDSDALAAALGVALPAPTRAQTRVLHTLAQTVAASPPGTAELIGQHRHEDALQPMTLAIALREQRRLRWQELEPRWRPELLGLDLDGLSRRYGRWQSAFVIFAFFMLFFARRKLAPVARGGVGDRREVTADLSRAMAVRADDVALRERATRVPEAFPDEPLDLVARRLGAARKLIQLRRELGVHGVTVDLQAALANAPEAARLDGMVRDFHDARERLERPLSRLQEVLDASPTVFDGDRPLDQLAIVLATMEERLRTLRDWAAWRRARAAAMAHGLEPFVQALESGSIGVDSLELELERSAMSWRIADAVKKDPVLRRFRGEDHADLGARFRALDAERQAAARDEIVLRLVARLPDGSIEAGEVGILRAEAKKKRRHLPLRKLFAKISATLPRLKPCVLASPMSVAAYLDPSLSLFDVVVFDEASQIPPWDAVGALGRGRSAVVVGDSKQMPPTNFFGVGDDDAIVDDDEPEELESILDECDRSGLQKLSLSWHYRSRHPSLIQFSNHHYYGGDLIAFPAAAADAPTLGVKWRRVAGRYLRGERHNLIEAEALVAEVLKRLSDPLSATKSIGIVTFAQPQQRLIIDLLDKARAADPKLEPFFASDAREPLFVKNLENVQGDERDVMLFSVGFGPAPDGKISLNLGALNRRGGERRLNVAVTRARELLIVYASMDASAIDTARVGALGVRHLKAFLEFAERGATIRAADELAARGRDQAHFLDRLRARLEAEGFTVDRDLAAQGPRIDLAVRDPKHPERYLLGVVTDSVAWARFPALRDREKLGLSVLANLGWTLVRVFALDVWQDGEREIARVMRELRRCIDAPAEVPPPAPAPVAAALIAASVAPAAPVATTPSWYARGVPYVRAKVPAIAASDALATPDAYRRVAERMAAVIAIEGPMHREEALRRTFASWQVTRVGPKMARLAEDHLHLLPAAERPRLEGDFYWPVGLAAAGWTAFRLVGPDGRREAEHIPAEEVGNALMALLERAVGITRAEAATHLAEAFGFERRGKKLDELFTRAIDQQVQRGRARERDGRIAAQEVP